MSLQYRNRPARRRRLDELEGRTGALAATAAEVCRTPKARGCGEVIAASRRRMLEPVIGPGSAAGPRLVGHYQRSPPRPRWVRGGRERCARACRGSVRGGAARRSWFPPSRLGIRRGSIRSRRPRVLDGDVSRLVLEPAAGIVELLPRRPPAWPRPSSSADQANPRLLSFVCCSRGCCSRPGLSPGR